jgi:ribosomal protein L14E/L6E/L27E
VIETKGKNAENIIEEYEALKLCGTWKKKKWDMQEELERNLGGMR